MQETSDAALELTRINKSFGAVQANRDVSLRVARGTIHGIVGENGAGKSTLMNILYGYYHADSGEIAVFGRRVKLDNSRQALALGIGMVHQHFMLVHDQSVLQNIILGAEGGVFLKPALGKARKHLQQMADEYDLKVDPDAQIDSLGVGQQQRVEVLKALYRGAQILILDEPTAVLTPDETDHLFRILLALKAQGKTIILITHKLREIIDYTDNVTVMRQGAVVGSVATAAVTSAQLAEMMVGRSVGAANNPAAAAKVQRSAQPVLAVRDVQLHGERGETLLQDISFDVHGGEIVGIAGVAGNGQSELLDILAGLRKADSGSIILQGQALQSLPETGATRPARHRALGIAHVPEDRLKMGVVKSFSCLENAILGSQRAANLKRGFLLSQSAIKQRVEHFIERFDIRPQNPQLRLGLLSGGNQQKLVLAREIERDAVLYLIGQPTRGVDIGAIERIHAELLALRAQGKAIILVSVELDEILALSDRIIVFCGGQISGSIDSGENTASNNDTTRQRLGLMMGGKSA